MKRSDLTIGEDYAMSWYGRATRYADSYMRARVLSLNESDGRSWKPRTNLILVALLDEDGNPTYFEEGREQRTAIKSDAGVFYRPWADYVGERTLWRSRKHAADERKRNNHELFQATAAKLKPLLGELDYGSIFFEHSRLNGLPQVTMSLNALVTLAEVLDQ